MYYEVSVPLKLDINLTYTSPIALDPGIRVIVTVGSRMYTGIVIKEVTPEELNPDIRYKKVLEVVDDVPVMSASMLHLAKWMSDYYWTSQGVVIDTMLPLALKHHVTQKVRLRNKDCEKIANFTEQHIVTTLAETNDWIPIETLRGKAKNLHFYHALENLEQQQIIEVYRTFDEKIKPKYANFIRILPPPEVALTKAQAKAYDTITSNAGPSNAIPLSLLAKDVSYAIIKTLQTKGYIEVFSQPIEVDLFHFPENQQASQVELNDEQKTALQKIINTLDQNTFKTFLLYGVTGSGKTEVYINAVLHCQRLGKSALMLVPEIALTPQMVHRFYLVFGKEIAVLHSNLNDRERYLQWKQIAEGRIKIVIGARSAIFAPLRNIGVIIVDEEHENSYKQEHQPCYHARDIAVMRGSMEQATVILGSATPSLESWDNVLKKKYSLLQLHTRPAGASLPAVEIVDMRVQKTDTFFSDILKEKIQDRLNKREQIILFHNRRGYANYVQCVHCGNVFKCSNCDISLAYHKVINSVVCHYCGFSEEVARVCTCGSRYFIYGSPGTEQIEAQLRLLFPKAKVLRMDSDTTHKKNIYNEMYESMQEHHIDILLGTQMISKGLDFHNVTLVGVVMADVSLNIPDFRSTERTFQLLTQVAGRSGRGAKNGEVVIQTLSPEHYAIVYALQQDFLSFSHTEIIMRAEAFYPPKCKLCRVLFSCDNLEFLQKVLSTQQGLLTQIAGQFPEDEFVVLPFLEAPISRIKNKYRYHFIIKSVKVGYVHRFLREFTSAFQCPAGVQMTIDVDAMSLL